MDNKKSKSYLSYIENYESLMKRLSMSNDEVMPQSPIVQAILKMSEEKYESDDLTLEEER